METNYAYQHDILSPLSLNIPSYQGPLDILLSLIRQKKMDILSISLSEICQPYLNYLDQHINPNLEESAEFFVIASTLILIKSKKLLPLDESDEMDGDEAEQLNPEEELKQRLVEYNRFKILTQDLLKKEILNRDVFKRGLVDYQEMVQDDQIDRLDLSIYQLIKQYQKLLNKKSYKNPYTVNTIEYSVADKKKELLLLFQTKEQLVFSQICGTNLQLIVVTFIALLELAQQNQIHLIQNDLNQTIFCKKHG